MIEVQQFKVISTAHGNCIAKEHAHLVISIIRGNDIGNFKAILAMCTTKWPVSLKCINEKNVEENVKCQKLEGSIIYSEVSG